MRIILKIIAAPFYAVLTVLQFFLTFLLSWATSILCMVSGLFMLLAIGSFIIGQRSDVIPIVILAYIISPLGLPLIAGWLLIKFGDLNESLQYFMRG